MKVTELLNEQEYPHILDMSLEEYLGDLASKGYLDDVEEAKEAYEHFRNQAQEIVDAIRAADWDQVYYLEDKYDVPEEDMEMHKRYAHRKFLDPKRKRRTKVARKRQGRL